MRSYQRGLSWAAFAAVVILIAIIAGCVGTRTTTTVPPTLNVKNEQVYDPEIWGKSYPEEYRTWLNTNDGERLNDKLSEYPYLALLYAGWGFGIEYNEPRGHFHMLSDQKSIDKSRLKAGGVCLACKTPYFGRLMEERGESFLTTPYEEADRLIKKGNGRIGPTCVDCHNPQNMELRPIRTADLEQLAAIGKSDLTYGDMRSIVCAQCHSSYVIPRDAEMKATGLLLPWAGGSWGDLSIEAMIAQIESDPANHEWTQSVTGLRLGFIRHPEYEMYSKGSVHWSKGVACSACHMDIETDAAGETYFSHFVESPLEDGVAPCLDCHPNSSENELKNRVTNIRSQSLREMNTAGYATAVAAKLLESINKLESDGANIDADMKAKAIADYKEAFYRVVFLAAENSSGFHNPEEARRIARDAASYASRCQESLKIILVDADAEVPANVNLELRKYLNGRGEKKLDFKAKEEVTAAGAFPDLSLLPYTKNL